ncbi:hypothetical protein DMI62_10045 [Escherichia coli]|nr:hypothetical protein [Escherichia coli]
MSRQRLITFSNSKKIRHGIADDFGDIVLKTADLCSAKDDCVRLKKCAGQSRQQ